MDGTGTLPVAHRIAGALECAHVPGVMHTDMKPADVMLKPTEPGAKPGWHRTEALDYNIVLGGELVLMLEEGEARLSPRDVVIQRNTMHAWRNDTALPGYWVAVLVPVRHRSALGDESTR